MYRKWMEVKGQQMLMSSAHFTRDCKQTTPKQTLDAHHKRLFIYEYFFISANEQSKIVP